MFEVNGLGRTPVPLGFRLEVRRSDRGFFRRAGEFLGLVDPEASITVAWEEESPGSLGPLFRWIDLELAGATPGAYEATLTLSLPGRAKVESGTRFAVVPGL